MCGSVFRNLLRDFFGVCSGWVFVDRLGFLSIRRCWGLGYKHLHVCRCVMHAAVAEMLASSNRNLKSVVLAAGFWVKFLVRPSRSLWAANTTLMCMRYFLKQSPCAFVRHVKGNCPECKSRNTTFRVPNPACYGEQRSEDQGSE